MLSPSRANHLIARVRCLPFSYTRNFTSSSSEVKREGTDPLASQLNHYFSLPPLPPTEEWPSHFPFIAPSVRDRVSIRTPASAIRVAHSFINSKKTWTGKPKVIIEAFPGAWRLRTAIVLFLTPSLGPGALSRAFLTLPPSQLQRLIILEDHEPYLEYLRVRFSAPFSAFTL